jgi:hypothetical protein
MYFFYNHRTNPYEKMLLSKIKSYLIEKSFYSFEEFLENKFTDFT